MNGSNDRKLRIAVFGGGHLGTIHARLLQHVPDAELVAIVEPSDVRAAELADEFSCDIVTHAETFAARAILDGAVIAAPTTLHHSLGLTLLNRGVPCLIEKPLATNVAECHDLVTAARRSNCVLQVGHVERFNPAWTTFRDRVQQPRYINATREGTLTFRSMDAGVVLDLMIHDIDLVLSMVNSPVTSIQATGFHWTGPAEDIAQAQLTFANGCIARFSSSRVSSHPKRAMTVYGDDWTADIDFAERRCEFARGPNLRDWQTRQYTPAERSRLMNGLYTEVLQKQELNVPDGNPILDELSDFVTSIQTGTTPIVSGFDGLLAVEIATQIIQQIDVRVATPPTYRKAG